MGIEAERAGFDHLPSILGETPIPDGGGTESGTLSGDSAKLAYLRAGWPEAPEGTLRKALAILNGAAVSEGHYPVTET